LDGEGKFCIAENADGYLGNFQYVSINSHDLKGLSL